MKQAPRMALAGFAIFTLAIVGFGMALDGYSQIRHAPALLGATGDGRAWAFNVLGFVLPGLLLAGAMFLLRSRQDAAGWGIRLGLSLWMLSALAFAAQGVLPVDASSVVAEANSRHAAAWSLWWMAFVPGALLLATGASASSSLRSLRWPVCVAAVLVPVAALLLPGLLPVGSAQRLAFGLWFACLAGTATVASRQRQP